MISEAVSPVIGVNSSTAIGGANSSDGNGNGNVISNSGNSNVIIDNGNDNVISNGISGANVEATDGSYSVTVTGDDTQVSLTDPASIALIAYGSNDKVFLSGVGSGSVDDKGSNFLLQVDGGPTGTLTIRDFQSDPGGILQLIDSSYTNTAEALVALRPDGSGGTVLPVSTGGQIDFVAASPQQLSGHILVGN